LPARGGKVIVTDGPYAETKEQLGGVAVFTISDVTRRSRFGPSIPARRSTMLEIRP
jgi:hypothetical protein